MLYHIDIGPTAAYTELNALLFQLLVISVPYDAKTGRLYNRSSQVAPLES